MTDEGVVEDLLDSRPGMADSLEAVLDVDERTDGWVFDDVPVDTGEFGVLVSEGIVEEVDDGYRVADRDAVLSALGEEEGTEQSGGFELPSVGVPDGVRSGPGAVSIDALDGIERDWTDVGAVASIVALFVATRAYIYGGVFREGVVVLTGNDPYFYRYLVERALAVAPTPLDVAVLANLPVATGEPLYVATMWLLAVALGGGTYVTGAVLAWYPVVAAAITGVFVYLLGARVAGDRRVGYVAAVTLALSPAYAVRTTLGFADHHAFDYIWLTATVAVLAWLAARESPVPEPTSDTASVDEAGGRGWGWGWGWIPDRFDGTERRATALLAVAVAGQTLSWANSPILLAPLGLYVAVKAPVDVSAGRSPVDANAPVIVALGVAGVLTLLVHLLLGWLPTITALAPVVLLAGSVGVVAVAELLRRRGRSARLIAGVEAVVVVAALGFLAVGPAPTAVLIAGLDQLFGTVGISEAESLFSPANYGGLEWFGLFLPLAVPALFWGVWRGIRGSGTWLALSVYGWYLLVLSAVQLRFMGPLAPVLAVFTGVGFVWALGILGVWAPPAPFRSGADGSDGAGERDRSEPVDGGVLTPRVVLIAVVCLLLVSGPSLAVLGPKVDVTVRDAESYETAVWMQSYADERGWEFPENKVFSRWDANRMYNYFVSGNARSYGYARRNYSEFIYGDDPDAWYPRLREQVGFVVVEPLPLRRGTVQSHLQQAYGSRFRDHDAVSHYRAVYAGESTNWKVFVLVPGATVMGTAAPNTTVELRTDVEIPNDSFPYRTQISTGPDGEYTAVVPYPGEYEIRAGNRTRQVTVPGRAVRNGTTVTVPR